MGIDKGSLRYLISNRGLGSTTVNEEKALTIQTTVVADG